MCGIFFSCSERDHCYPSETLLETLQRRGPDSVSTILRSIKIGPAASQKSGLETQTTTCSLTFVSTVLSLRGNSLASQPLEDPSCGSILCWNGEAWKTTTGAIQGNDAKVVFDLLLDVTQSPKEKATDYSPADEEKLQHVVKTIGSIAGPYAFVFYDAPSQRLFYGRDALVRCLFGVIISPIAPLYESRDTVHKHFSAKTCLTTYFWSGKRCTDSEIT